MNKCKFPVRQSLLLPAIFGGAIALFALSTLPVSHGTNSTTVVTYPPPTTSRNPQLEWTQFMTWAKGKLEAISDAGGMEMESAGFHLCRPGGTEHDVSALSASPMYAPRHAFHTVSAPYNQGYPEGSADLSVFSMGYATVAVGRLFDNSLLASAFSVNEQVGSLTDSSVYVVFDAAGVSRLSGLTGVASYSGPYQDWYYTHKMAGELPTPMFATLVAEDAASIPFSITEIVNQQIVGVPIQVASNLNPVEAASLVALLGF